MIKYKITNEEELCKAQKYYEEIKDLVIRYDRLTDNQNF